MKARFPLNGFWIPLLLLTFGLAACSPSLSSSETVPTLTATSLSPTLITPSRTATNTQTPTLLPSLTPTITVTPTITPTPIHLTQSIVDMPIATPIVDEKCGGMYPIEIFGISWVVGDAIKTLDPNAEGWVEGIVQSCTDKDGKTHGNTFGIWFHIGKSTPNLKDFKTLGAWIIDVMNLLDTIPRDEETTGAEPTNAIFTFYADNSDPLEVIVPVQEYWTKASGKSAEEVFQIFYKKP